MKREHGRKRRVGSSEGGPQSSVKHLNELEVMSKSTKGSMRVARGSQPISMAGIKALVSSHFPPGHSLREVILAEKENLEPEELLAKMETWLILLNQSNRASR